MLLCGKPPFNGKNDKEILDNVQIGKYDIDNDDWDNISMESKELIKNMLLINPDKRFSAK